MNAWSNEEFIKHFNETQELLDRYRAESVKWYERYAILETVVRGLAVDDHPPRYHSCQTIHPIAKAAMTKATAIIVAPPIEIWEMG